jgi:hypothetical protein
MIQSNRNAKKDINRELAGSISQFVCSLSEIGAKGASGGGDFGEKAGCSVRDTVFA